MPSGIYALTSNGIKQISFSTQKLNLTNSLVFLIQMANSALSAFVLFYSYISETQKH